MSDLQQQFEEATRAVKTISARPSNETLLSLYASYKQATKGDATGKRPGLLDPQGRAKFDAWKALEGTAGEDAMRMYIDRVAELTS